MRLDRLALLGLTAAMGSACVGTGQQPAAEATAGSEVEAAATGMATATTPDIAQEQRQEPACSPATQISTPPALQIPPYAAIIVHQVKSYDRWRPVFDGDEEARKAAGIVGEGVMRGVDDDKTVAIYCPAVDLERVTTFLRDATLKAKMKAAGVTGKPTVYLFKLIAARMVLEPTGDVYAAIVKYGVKDFEAFRSAVEAANAERAAAGLIGWGIGQDTTAPNAVYVYLQSSDPAQLNAYLGADATKSAMRDAGATGKPKITLVKEVTNRMYE